MLRHSEPVFLSYFIIFAVSVALLQEHTFERVSIKYGKAITFVQARSVRTCMDSCIHHCQCRYVRFTKSTKGCQLFDSVLLYSGGEISHPDSDVVDFKKVLYNI